MKFAVVFSSLVAAVYAQTINTPESVLACAFHQVTFTGGTAPYVILVQPGGDTSAAPLETFSGIACSPFTWFVDQAAGTSVFLRLQDSVGSSVSTAPFTIQPGTNNGTCVHPSATPTAGCAAGSTATGAAGGGGAAGTTAAGGSNTSAAGGSNTTPAPSGGSGGSGSNTSASHAASTTTSRGAGFSNQVGIGALVGFAAAGLAALA